MRPCSQARRTGGGPVGQRHGRIHGSLFWLDGPALECSNGAWPNFPMPGLASWWAWALRWLKGGCACETWVHLFVFCGRRVWNAMMSPFSTAIRMCCQRETRKAKE